MTQLYGIYLLSALVCYLLPLPFSFAVISRPVRILPFTVIKVYTLLKVLYPPITHQSLLSVCQLICLWDICTYDSPPQNNMSSAYATGFHSSKTVAIILKCCSPPNPSSPFIKPLISSIFTAILYSFITLNNFCLFSVWLLNCNYQNLTFQWHPK